MAKWEIYFEATAAVPVDDAPTEKDAIEAAGKKVVVPFTHDGVGISVEEVWKVVNSDTGEEFYK